jgi:hypothetical protein
MNGFPAGNRRVAELSLIARVREREWEAKGAFRRPPSLLLAFAGP